MNPKSKSENILEYIIRWSARKKSIMLPHEWHILDMSDHIYWNILPLFDRGRLPIDIRKMDQDTWNHVRSVLDSHHIPYVIV